MVIIVGIIILIPVKPVVTIAGCGVPVVVASFVICLDVRRIIRTSRAVVAGKNIAINMIVATIRVYVNPVVRVVFNFVSCYVVAAGKRQEETIPIVVNCP